MAGAVIENMSTTQLCIVGEILLISQVIAFLVGGLMDKCLKKLCQEEAQEMNPWLQFMIVTMQLDIMFEMDNAITLEHMKANSDCDMPSFMEIGTVAHLFYLISIRLSVNESQGINAGVGEIKDVCLMGIHQNKYFTKMWFAMKTFFTPIIFITLVWYWRRITMLTRAPVLLENLIFALGISMTFINIPVEWFSIRFDWTLMLLFEDIRQGIFYAMFLSFWIIFCGECVKGQNDQTWLSGYWKWVGPIAVGSFCLFIFVIYKRGVQLKKSILRYLDYRCWHEAGHLR
ncbi:unnamed protein product [Natator depressus]